MGTKPRAKIPVLLGAPPVVIASLGKTHLETRSQPFQLGESLHVDVLGDFPRVDCYSLRINVLTRNRVSRVDHFSSERKTGQTW